MKIHKIAKGHSQTCGPDFRGRQNAQTLQGEGYATRIDSETYQKPRRSMVVGIQSAMVRVRPGGDPLAVRFPEPVRPVGRRVRECLLCGRRQKHAHELEQLLL